MDNNMLSIIEVPLELGSDIKGLKNGPGHLMSQKFEEILKSVGFQIENIQSVSVPSYENLSVKKDRVSFIDAISQVLVDTAGVIQAELDENRRVITIGGDHSIALGSISGASVSKHGELGIIWIDAHPDLHTHDTTPSGLMHGMPAAALLGYGHESLTHLHAPHTKIKKENFLFIGIKDTDEAEEKLIQDEGLKVYSMLDIMRYGFDPVLQAIEQLQYQTDHIWVSLDLDSIDKIHAPGVGIPTPGGFTYREIATLAKFIGKNCAVSGIDIVELNPQTDHGNITAKLGIELLISLLGKDYSPYTQFMQERVK